MKCHGATPRAKKCYLRMKRIFAESETLSTKGAALLYTIACVRLVVQEFAERLAPASTSVNLVEGTPAFKRPSR
jgi:hypothetical protein